MTVSWEVRAVSDDRQKRLAKELSSVEKIDGRDCAQFDG